MPKRRTAQRISVVLVAATICALILIQLHSGPAQEDAGTLIRRHAAAVRTTRDLPYQPPTPRERDGVGAAWELLERGRRSDAAAAFREHRYRLRDVRLTGAGGIGRPVTVVEGSGGLFLFDPDGEGLVIEIPHPVADRRTEDFGIELFLATRARVLLVAGAHRDAGGADVADAAHQTGTVFHALHLKATASPRQLGALTVLQVHGFARATAPELDVIVSNGRTPTASIRRMAVALALRYRACQWTPATTGPCAALGGTRNAQGRTLSGAAETFIHLELAPPLRLDPVTRRQVVEAVATALRS